MTNDFGSVNFIVKWPFFNWPFFKYWCVCALLVGMQNDAAAMENSMEVPQKIKNKTTVWSSNPTFGYIFKGNSKDLKGIFTQ